MRKGIAVIFLLPACLTGLPAQGPDGARDQDASTEPEPEADPEPEPDPESDPDPTDDGGGFVPDPDVPVSNSCEDLGSDECRPGFKCTLGWAEYDLIQVCAPLADDPLPSGSPCERGDEPGVDDCGADAVCWDAGTGTGTCLRFCNDIDDYEAAEAQCGEGFTCNYFKSLPGDDAICTPTCTPLEDNCPNTCGCTWVGSDFLCVPLSENVPTGQPCEFVNSCAMDHYCAEASLMPDCEGTACCAAHCRVSEGSCEQPGTACVPFFEDGSAPPGLADVGVCVSPGA
jgi:hypothetical protein